MKTRRWQTKLNTNLKKSTNQTQTWGKWRKWDEWNENEIKKTSYSAHPGSGRKTIMLRIITNPDKVVGSLLTSIDKI